MPGPNASKSTNKLSQNKSCGWCEDPRRKLKLAFTHDHIKKEFCSEACLNQYRNTYFKVFFKLYFQFFGHFVYFQSKHQMFIYFFANKINISLR
jgi:hypothetical protein